MTGGPCLRYAWVVAMQGGDWKGGKHFVDLVVERIDGLA